MKFYWLLWSKIKALRSNSVHQKKNISSCDVQNNTTFYTKLSVCVRFSRSWFIRDETQSRNQLETWKPSFAIELKIAANFKNGLLNRGIKVIAT